MFILDSFLEPMYSWLLCSLWEKYTFCGFRSSYFNIFWILVLEKTLESPLDLKETKPVHPKRNQPWIFIERTDAKAKVPILWPRDAKNHGFWEKTEETLILGKTEGKRRDRQRMRWSDSIASPTQWTWTWANSWRQWRSMELQRVGHTFANEHSYVQLS